MPDEILSNASEIIEGQLNGHLEEIGSELDADMLTLISPLVSGIEDLTRDAVEDIENKKDKLAVIVETAGGYISVTQRIVEALRHHYQTVEFIIPNYAMSAGTVLVMSGDAIYMDYFSVLGPIDPQVQSGDSGPLIPALGYIEQYNALIEKSQTNNLTRAEMAYLVAKFDPGELSMYEHERDLTITLLKEWLVKYKFKNWKKTRSRKKHVTKGMRAQRATHIAKQLNNIKKWHSHSRGISMPTLVNDLRLEIEDFGQMSPLNEKIRMYYRLLKDYMGKNRTRILIHTLERYESIA